MILLDTDHLTVMAFPDSVRGQALLTRVQAAGDEPFGTTIVTAEEQVRGWLAKINREKSVHRQIPGYRSLLDTLSLLAHWTIVPFDESAADEFERQRLAGIRRLGTRDLKIASIARTRGALLLSANLRDFQQVPGLRVENWMD